MRRLFPITILSFLLLSTQSFSQDTTYQGLLWKISGNGMKSPSYLYGTMHVSDKLVFNLPDEFFKGLQSVDAVALESLPDTWLDDMKKMENSPLKKYWSLGSEGYGRDPYNHVFDFSQPFLERFRNYLDVKDYKVNGILYRKNRGNENFELNTYLDMFLFQSGSKLNKQMYSLEDNTQVEEWIAEARKKDREEKAKAKISYWNMDEGMNMEEAYRRGDLDLLDSISRLTSTENMHNAMIVLRNQVMAQQMDSIMHHQSLFTGIGAAHLAGNYGVINLLREMGYEVEPANQRSSNKANKERQKLEALTRPVSFQNRKTADGVITVATPEPLMSMSDMMFGGFGGGRSRTQEENAIDYVNGAYYSVSRIHTYAPFFGFDQQYIMASIDSVLFIDMPGDVLETKKINISGFPGYDVMAKTYKGDIIRYQLAITPLEIIIFKAIGVNDYVTKQSSQFFRSIQIKYDMGQPGELLTVGRLGFSAPGMVKLPRSQEKGIMPGGPLEVFDPQSQTYFILQRNRYEDEYLEDDRFELEYIAERFAKDMDVELVNFNPKNIGEYPALRALFRHADSTEFEAMFTLKGADYYCLASNKARTAEVDQAFASMTMQKSNMTDALEAYVDTVGLYEVVTFDLESRYKEEFEEFRKMIESRYAFLSDDEDDPFEEYRPVQHRKSFIDPVTGDYISLRYYQSDRFFWRDSNDMNVDSMRADIEEHYSYQVIVNLTLDSLEDGYLQDLTLADTACSRGIRILESRRGPRHYEIFAYYDTLEGLSPFMSTFFETFKPKDTVLANDIFEDKTSLYMDLWRGDSSERAIAEEFFNRMVYRLEDGNALLEMLNCYLQQEDEEDKDDKKENHDYLYGYMGYDEDEEMPASHYVDRILGAMMSVDSVDITALVDLYKAETENAERQLDVIRILANQETSEAYKTILELFEHEVPTVNEDYQISSTFDAILDNDSLAIEIFPTLYRLKRYPEFKNSALRALMVLYESERITDKELKKYQMDIEDQLDLVIRDKKSGGDQFADEFNDLNRFLMDKEVLALIKEMEHLDDPKQYRRLLKKLESKTFSNLDFENSYLLGLRNLLRVTAGEDSPIWKKTTDRLIALEDTTLLVEMKVNDHLKSSGTDTALFRSLLQNEEYALEAFDYLESAGIIDSLDLTVDQRQMVTWKYTPNNDNYRWRAEEEDTLIFLERRFIESKMDTGYVYFFKVGSENNWSLKYSSVQPKDTTQFNDESNYDRYNDYRYEYEYGGYGRQKRANLDKEDEVQKAIDEHMRELSLRHHPRIGGGTRWRGRATQGMMEEVLAEDYGDY